ncbi:hypothetical protein [Mitsuaria sp. GD03876]|uniref:hypothetical protein n=1 Tax=Mitsuaria sp. GD03876 TaxID=2975399 RepID=UPI00244A4A0C|nr:hypothetical protein [Mitsuaria sp. GD03876]MDH0866431.1 hypothetical protein [Mitsuaria sp. GD03876]
MKMLQRKVSAGHRKRTPLLALLATTLHLQALADGPLPANQVWVELDVKTCSAVTFEAPDDKRFYVVGEKHRTAVIVGTVVRSGFAGPAADAHQEARRAPRLPLPNASAVYALPAWEEKVCQRIGSGVKRFRFDDWCDTLPHRGRCVSPVQMVTPDLRTQP